MNDKIPSSPLTVSAVQNSAGKDVARNLEALERLVFEAPHSDVIAFPEVFAARGDVDDYRAGAETISRPGSSAGNAAGSATSPIMKWLGELAASRGSWILAGSIIEKESSSFFNTSVLLNREGVLEAAYRKIHLFEAHLDNGKVVIERMIYEAGSDPVMVSIEGWRCGMSICYDLRFPELYRHYSKLGAHLFFVPSDFTQKTGTDHWETLIRARAIENQAFVVAPDQCGCNPCSGIASYGHSLVAGPWGDVLCKARDGECVITATLDPSELAGIRERIPALQHRRL